MRSHFRYLSYVLRHKWWVFVAGVSLAIEYGPPAGPRGISWARWLLQLAVHDRTKFLPREWRPYVARFYGPGPEPVTPAVYVSGPGGPRQIGADEPIPDEVIAEAMDGFSAAPNEHGLGQGAWTAALVRELLERERRPYVPAEDPEIHAAFDVAWNHHQKRNPHHWQYWLLTLDSPRPLDPGFGTARQTIRLEMPERYAMEMVADWAGAGRAITGRWEVARWYEENQSRIQIHGDTRLYVERLLRVFMTPDHDAQVRKRIAWGAEYVGDGLLEGGEDE